MDICCVCRRSLPNRYAVAGRCEEPDCDAAFCALHWGQSNRRCRTHGGDTGAPPPTGGDSGGGLADTSIKEPEMYDEQQKSQAEPRLDPAKTKAAMKQAVQLAARLGAGAGALIKKLKKDRSPEAMIQTLDQGLDTNRPRREAAAQRLEELYNEITTKKREHAAAPKARQRVLEAELQSKLAEYKTREREFKVLLENERTLNQVRGRLSEMIAYGMAAVTEDLIDDVAVDLEEAVIDAEARADAARDLEKAGRRRESEGEAESMWEQLDEFEIETPAAAEPEPASFAEDIAAPSEIEESFKREEPEEAM